MIEHEGKQIFSEGCLSLPGLGVQTDRWIDVLIENGFEGERKREYYNGFAAIIVQHEMDHLNGKTILDRKHRRK
jgi:peptide deformylase